MAKETAELLKLISQVPSIEKLFTADSAFPTLKTINGNVDFKIWSATLKAELLKLKQEGLVLETVDLLTNGFKNGFTDQKDFNSLKGNLVAIGKSVDATTAQPTSRLKGKITPIYGKLANGQMVYTAFSQYELIKQIGSGGNGRVFSAKDADGEEFAIKFIDKYQSTTKLKRFKNEINFCEQHKHKNIVQVLDRGQAFLDGKDLVFYVMPLYAETLRDKIKAGIPHENILDIFVGLLEGLKFSHEHGSVHRDIKPENIMFAKDSLEPVICDFGIAHFAEEDLLTVIETRATDRMANFQYAAPEQRKRGGDICFQTDIYALALILNEMFTREIPQAADYKTIASINPDYQYLDDVFVQMFRQEPIDRLYPESTILSEIKRLAEQYKRNAEKKMLQSKMDDFTAPDEFNAAIIGKSYENGFLVFEFNQELPTEWIQVLISGSYSCSGMWGYEHEKLKRIDSTKVGMPLCGNEDEDTLRTVITNMQQWVSTINGMYTQALKVRAREEQQRKEDARKAEIKRLEQTDSISSLLAKL